jgi:hypothetical protein
MVALSVSPDFLQWLAALAGETSSSLVPDVGAAARASISGIR